ncbi:MAG: 1-deoxy-D-xylulose-5-phosphate synthase [Clostridia bacterium]|nr:1-deoxy-D-xylulose-5-phosphate synthase [Clostridia bacterium]
MTEHSRLNKIKSVSDLKAMREEEMPMLAREIRSFLWENVNKTGGHLASNLGVVEMTLAIHRLFDTPKDHIIFDVGHQSYVHKLLTGRNNFDELRIPGGLSGFTKRSESEHDCFGAGHSSTSLSAALGFAESDARQGSDAYTVVVLGDGAFTGGMIHEAINNCREDLRLIIILNENEMSISRNKGGFATHLSKMRNSKRYFKVKNATHGVLDKIPLVGKGAANLIRDTKQALKNAIYKSNYFEHLGLYYMGPVDGNDYSAVSDVISVAKSLERSTVIHMVTKKGKGFKESEEMPQHYHMVPKGGLKPEVEGFSANLGRILSEKAEVCDDICGITAAMPHGTGMEVLKYNHRDRFYDVGIAEEHAATFAAGLAANGMRPFFACYSSFLQRAYDNIIHDVALQSLPVTLCIDRTGLNEGDGATHHGIFDVSFLSGVPGLEIYTPVTYESLGRAIDLAYERALPCAIRYPKGGENADIKDNFYSNGHAFAPYIRSDFDKNEDISCVIITYGGIASETLRAEKLFAEKGIKCGTLLLEKLKPYGDIAAALADTLPDTCDTVVFLEEGIRNGGAALCLYDKLRAYPVFDKKRYIVHAIDDDFVLGEKGRTLRQSAKLTAEDIIHSYFDKK